jgi:hypothetical protein
LDRKSCHLAPLLAGTCTAEDGQAKQPRAQRASSNSAR